MTEGQELSTLERMRAARLAERRDAYQVDLAIIAPLIMPTQQEAEPAKHRPDHAEPFKSFQVLHLIETKSADGRPNTKAEIGTFEDIDGDVSHSRQMPIEKIRTLPQYVGECWSLVGWTKDSDATTIGDFQTERMARDVLGGITGDRNFDKHPSQDWTLAAGWARFAHEDDGFKPSLSDRMAGDFNDEQQGRVTDARRRATAELERELPEPLPLSAGYEAGRPLEEVARDRFREKVSDRPHEQIIGEGRTRW